MFFSSRRSTHLAVAFVQSTPHSAQSLARQASRSRFTPRFSIPCFWQAPLTALRRTTGRVVRHGNESLQREAHGLVLYSDCQWRPGSRRSFLPRVWFVVAAYFTAAIGVWIMLRHRRRSATHAEVTPQGSRVRLTGVICVSLAAIALQYAAMFSVFSNSLHFLTISQQSTFPLPRCRWSFSVLGGIAGALLTGHLLRNQPALTALFHPIALAVVYAALYLFAHGPDALTAIAVLS